MSPILTVTARDVVIRCDRTIVMGIVNVTPDSFSGDGLLKSKFFVSSAVRLALRQIKDGADIVDIGGESSRPGAKKISAREETRRIIPVIKRLGSVAKIPISVDTYKGETAARALDAGASIINNIRGTRPDSKLLKMAAAYDAAIVVMHMRGDPGNMQGLARYRDPVAEIINELRSAVEICLENGVKSDKIIIDPGIGFAKTAEQNLEIICRLRELNIFRRPILIGVSRKSFIAKTIGPDPALRLAGTAASAVMAMTNGAHMIRVHDVKFMAAVAAMIGAIKDQVREKNP